MDSGGVYYQEYQFSLNSNKFEIFSVFGGHLENGGYFEIFDVAIEFRLPYLPNIPIFGDIKIFIFFHF